MVAKFVTDHLKGINCALFCAESWVVDFHNDISILITESFDSFM